MDSQSPMELWHDIFTMLVGYVSHLPANLKRFQADCDRVLDTWRSIPPREPKEAIGQLPVPVFDGFWNEFQELIARRKCELQDRAHQTAIVEQLRECGQPRKRPSTGRERIAYHESGHAVAAIALQRRFNCVTIKAHGDYLGHVKMHATQADNTSQTFRSFLWWQRAIAIRLAGPISEIVFVELDDYLDCFGEDWKEAKGHASLWCGSEEQVREFLDMGVNTVSKIFTTLRWGTGVEALATELLRRDKIGYFAARKIVLAPLQGLNLEHHTKRRRKKGESG